MLFTCKFKCKCHDRTDLQLPIGQRPSALYTVLPNLMALCKSKPMPNVQENLLPANHLRGTRSAL